jgi:hypothetical protein
MKATTMTQLRNFLELSYEQLEDSNLETKTKRMNRVAPDT